MKYVFIIASIFITSHSFANQLCERNINSAVKKEVKNHRKDHRRFRVEHVDCRFDPNNGVYRCEALGSNGDGAGDMSFMAIVSTDCKKVYEVHLTGEE